jgi:hypothetical protein
MADAPDIKAQQAAQQAQLQAFMRSPVPRIYANGFGVAQSASDISVVLLHNNFPAGMLSMSFISAKSLVNDLQKTIEGIEATLKQSIPTINEVTEQFEKNFGKPNV